MLYLKMLIILAYDVSRIHACSHMAIQGEFVAHEHIKAAVYRRPKCFRLYTCTPVVWCSGCSRQLIHHFQYYCILIYSASCHRGTATLRLPLRHVIFNRSPATDTFQRWLQSMAHEWRNWWTTICRATCVRGSPNSLRLHIPEYAYIKLSCSETFPGCEHLQRFAAETDDEWTVWGSAPGAWHESYFVDDATRFENVITPWRNVALGKWRHGFIDEHNSLHLSSCSL